MFYHPVSSSTFGSFGVRHLVIVMYTTANMTYMCAGSLHRLQGGDVSVHQDVLGAQAHQEMHW